MSATWSTMSCVVNPFAYSDSTWSSNPDSRLACFGTITGSKLPSRSRGASIVTGLGPQLLGQLVVQARSGQPEPPVRSLSGRRLLDRRHRGRLALTPRRRGVILVPHRMIQSGHHPKVVDHHGSLTSTRIPTGPPTTLAVSISSITQG